MEERGGERRENKKKKGRSRKEGKEGEQKRERKRKERNRERKDISTGLGSYFRKIKCTTDFWFSMLII